MSAPTYTPSKVESQPKSSLKSLPQSWETPDNRVASMLFKALCVASFGRTTLDNIWDVIQPENGEGWKEEMKTLKDRMDNMNVVVRVIQVNSMSLLHATQLLPEGWVTADYDVCIVVYNTAFFAVL